MLGCPICRRPWPCACGYTPGPDDDFTVGERDALTTRVGDFYERHPFPDYHDLDDLGALLQRGRRNPFTAALDASLPLDARVVELGCGTGQMSAFLGIAGRAVVGVDLSRASLGIARAFAARSGLDNVRYVRGDLLRPPIVPGSADVVLANGVLHHTADARRAFGAMVELCRPGGYVFVGLYNRYGRLLLPLWRGRHRRESGRRGLAWYHDQHEHPHETRHTVDEVLGWFDEEGVRFVSASPPVTFVGHADRPFEPTPRGSALEHLLAQLGWLGRAEDGGLWITVGRKAQGALDHAGDRLVTGPAGVDAVDEGADRQRP